MILPRFIIFYLIAVRVVDGGELLRNLFSVRPRPSLNLVRTDMELPARACPIYPAVGPRVLERKAGFGHVVGVANVDDRITVRLVIGVRLVHDGKNCGPRRRSPTPEDPRALERVAGEG